MFRRPEMVVAILDSSLKSGHHTPPEIFVTGGRLCMSLNWTSCYSRWDPSRDYPRGSRPGDNRPATYSQPSRKAEEFTREKKRRSTSTPRSELSLSRRGRTEGSFAAGVWAAREDRSRGPGRGDLLSAHEHLAAVRVLKKERCPRLGALYTPGRKRSFEGITFSKKVGPPEKELDAPESPGYFLKSR